MKIKSIYIIGFMVFLGVQLFGQSEKKLVREGNNLYEEGNFQEAEIEYRKALSEKPDYQKGKFNLGDAMYSQENYEESGKIYSELGEISKSSDVKSGSWYNLGNSLMQQQKYKESIEAYKKALRVNPDDQDAKYNLEYARQMLNEQQQQQQNQDQNQDQGNKNQDQENKNQDQENKNQEQENKDQEQQKDQNKDQQDQNQQQDQKDQQQEQQDQGDQQQQQNQPQPQQISKEDAQRMLDALKNDEKRTLQELQEQKAKVMKTKKSDIDW